MSGASDSGSQQWAGVNNWGLASKSGSGYASVCGSSIQYLDAKMQLFVQNQISVVRVAAYQSMATTTSGQRDWSGLDTTFAAAAANNIKLIPILGNNWMDCDYIGPRPSYCGSTSSGKGCTNTCGATWYDTGYKQVTDGYPVSFQTWASEVVARYRGHAALAAWEVLNEPWGKCVHNFFSDVTTRIRAADPTTPISLGGSEAGGWDFRTENSLPNVTWATTHYYGHATETMPPYLANDLAIAKSLGKPLYIGENGIQGSDIGGQCDTQYRADLFLQKFQAAFTAGILGYLPWTYSHTTALGTCSFSFGPSSPVIADFPAIRAWLTASSSPTAPAVATATATPSPTATVTPTLDSDGDGCPDAKELGSDWHAGGQRDPYNGWDFFDVPVPALLPGATSGQRDHVISVSDVIAILNYIGTSAANPTQVNGGGAAYGTDLNNNGIPDGREYDRSQGSDPAQPWRSGAPRGFVAIGSAIVALAQVGTDCR